MRRRVNDNFYARPENVRKRETFCRQQKIIENCGVKFLQDKPWYCGESELCCEICKQFYHKNKFNTRGAGI